MSNSYFNYALLDQLLVSGTNFLTIVLIARYAGVEEFGLFAIFWIFIQFSITLQMSLIVYPMMSIGPKSKSDSIYFSAAKSSAIAYNLLLLFVTVVLGLILYLFMSDNYISACVLLLGVANFGICLQDFFRRYFFDLNILGQHAINIERYKIITCLVAIKKAD